MNQGVDTARLFLALWPDKASRPGLAGCRDAWRWNAGASVGRSDQLHLTLHFIGSIPRARLPDLALSFQVAFDPFDLTLDRHELWPRGTAVVRPETAPAELLRLHAALGDGLQAQGLPVDAREFRPHVTLARRALGAMPPAIAPAFCWRVNGCALLESVPGEGYRIERDFPFK